MGTSGYNLIAFVGPLEILIAGNLFIEVDHYLEFLQVLSTLASLAEIPGRLHWLSRWLSGGPEKFVANKLIN